MASADPRKELECSVCLCVYTDPVNLICGHNFCRVCIDGVMDAQEPSGVYSCPDCREEFQERPALHRNLTLRNLVNTLPSKLSQEGIGIVCTYCVEFVVPAVKSCLLCEASLCEKHLRVHSTSPEHVITDPIISFGNRKCSEHKELLRYFCTEDTVCVCVSCCLIGEHRGHRMESLEKAYEKKKLQLRNTLQKMSTARENAACRVQCLQERRKKVQEKAASEAKRVTVMFGDLRKQLEGLEKKALSDISWQAERASLLVSNLIQQLEIKQDELSRTMRYIEELCNTADPLTVLQESETGDLCVTEEEEEEDNGAWERRKKLPNEGDLNVAEMLNEHVTCLSDILRDVNISIGPAYILLDVATAHNFVQISHDGTIATRSSTNQNWPQTPERFQGHHQVLSKQSFCSGYHYWEVDVSGSDHWRVGMCYLSIDRKGVSQSLIGENNKSWCLEMWNNKYSVIHDGKKNPLPRKISSNKVRIDLDYANGRLSFYDLCHPVRHLCSYTTTFTEPLCAALNVWLGCIKISGGPSKMSMRGNKPWTSVKAVKAKLSQ